MLLLPVLEKVGHADRAFLFALDEPAVEAFTRRGLPTIRQHTNARHDPKSSSSDGFRWEPGEFRKYGVTKADVILTLLRAGRDVCMSDVDAAWVATPYALLASVPDADVLSGTDCLHVPADLDRSTREKSAKNSIPVLAAPPKNVRSLLFLFSCCASIFSKDGLLESLASIRCESHAAMDYARILGSDWGPT